MIRTIENEFLRIQISDFGAELCSVYDKKNNREILWQADPAFWKRHAPVLFPNVGRHFGDHFRIKGKEYPSKQHGFARDSEFVCLDSSADSVTHQLTSTEETKKVYPFDFNFQVKHVLSGNQISVCWKVINTGTDTMYFTIGGHPAFNVPILENTDYAEYKLSFGNQTSLSYILLNPLYGTAEADVTYELPLTDGCCNLDPHMFDKDALVFDNEQITCAGILLPDGTPYLEISCEGFPNFGIWSVPGAPFVCLEPWAGRCDNCGFNGDIAEKAGINTVRANEIFEKDYSIKVF